MRNWIIGAAFACVAGSIPVQAAPTTVCNLPGSSHPEYCLIVNSDGSITTSGGGGGDVNITEVGGIPVATTVPVSGTVTAVGAAADAAAASGNPVPAGAVYESAPPTYTAGQRSTGHTGTRGAWWVQLMAPDNTASLSAAVTNTDTLSVLASGTGLVVNAVQRLWNGTNFSRHFEAANALNTTGTGIATAANVAQCDDTSPLALTENSFGNVRINCTTHDMGVDSNVAKIAGTAVATGSGAMSAGVQRMALATDSPGVITLGQAARTASVPVTIADINSGEYETVAASQTAQALGASGATGDYLLQLVCVPATTSPGVVTALDNATAIVSFPGGASSVSNLLPFTIPVNAYSVSGAWKVTTGANVSCVGVGNFT